MKPELDSAVGTKLRRVVPLFIVMLICNRLNPRATERPTGLTHPTEREPQT